MGMILLESSPAVYRVRPENVGSHMDQQHGKFPLPLVPEAPGSAFSCFTRRARRTQSYTEAPGKYLATLHTPKVKLVLSD